MKKVASASVSIAKPLPRRSRTSASKPSASETTLSVQAFKNILAFIHQETGLDFSRYKRGTLERRIIRRMNIRHMKDSAAYLRHLRKEPQEAACLADDILIHVTEFFRDPTLFPILSKKVFPRLLHKRAPGKPVRIWVPGCASGEEVYSIAIALLEYMQRRGLTVPVQLFGTDISESSLARARQGRYDKRALAGISPERIRRFFVPTEREDVLQVSKVIRDLCIFARHNIVSDTPFSQIDLISCRNVLIYLDESLQKRTIPVFHYALQESGFLVLGTSETTGGFEDLFAEVDKKHRVYEKKMQRARLSMASVPDYRAIAASSKKPPGRLSLVVDVEKEAAKLLLAKYTPAWVVISDDLTVVQLRGNTHPFLEAPAGKATLNLLKMARRELISTLSEAISAARQSKGIAKRGPIPLSLSGRIEDCRIEVVPLGSVQERSFLVLFMLDERVSEKRYPKSAGKLAATRERDQQIAQLQEELSNTTEYLQSLIEKQEAANEELRSANEEVTSANEELQSMNEELETTQEELRSSNEELLIVNAELEHRNRELRQSNEQLLRAQKTLQESEERRRLILESLQDYAIFMLDKDGCITTWNHAAQEIKQYKEKEIIGKHFSIFYTPEDKKHGKPKCMLALATRDGRVEDRSWRVRKNGTRFWADVIITAVRDKDGKLIGFVKATRDLTEMKKLEDAKDEAFSMLEERVRARTQELHKANQALEEENRKRKELEAALRARAAFLSKADKQKDLFLATLSHEVRNPLAPIVSAVELLKLQHSVPQEAAELIDIIEHQTRQLTLLLRDLLDVSRIMQGKVELAPAAIQLQDVIAHARSAVAPELATAECALTLELPQKPVRITADPVRIEQILVNLLDNAIKYTDAGDHITLSLKEKNRHIVLTVKDNGIGISAGKLEAIFDPFLQLEDGPTKRGGLGIGLMLARNLARLHGGDLVAKSEGAGKGSEFILTLPKAR